MSLAISPMDWVQVPKFPRQSGRRHRVPALHELDIAVASCSYDVVGGDYYDLIPLVGGKNSRRLLVAIGDVSGHGVSAALVMSAARGILRSRAQVCSSPAELLAHLNDLLASDAANGSFMTMHLGLIDLDNDQMVWSGAGHDPVMRYDPDTDRFQDIRASGIPLGIEPGIEYHQERFPGLRVGQILALGTDGIWETRDPAGQMFGKKRLRASIRAAAAASADEILDAARDEVAAFRGPAQAHDDATLVIIKALPADAGDVVLS